MMKASDLELTGQVAVVTGGGGGIGRAIALCLADLGADLTIVDVVPERCEETAARIAERGRHALAFPANVMDTDKVREAIDATKTRFGRLDILINNAGGVTRRPFLDLQEKNWRRHIDLNLVSMLTATHAAVPIMIEGGRGGAIVNVSSIEGSRAAPGYAVYAGCKAAINNITRTLALEFAEHDIRINTIAPDYTVTPGTRGNFTGPVDPSKWYEPNEAQLEAIRRRIPAGRAGVDEECGTVAAFLCSKLASYVTGAVVPVDGGSWASSGWVRDDTDDWILPPQARP
jgi:NAD(P)-dependent dehydrogenase (short-subunit alcohol dehydrogenase family)